jgi:hypothetical protein
MGLPLRPLEIKQLFDFAIRTYRANFVPIVLLTALMQAPMAAAATLFVYHLTNFAEVMQGPLGEAADPGKVPDPLAVLNENLPTWIIIGTVFTLAAIFQLALLPLIHVAVSRLCACYLTGEECSVREALRFAGERYWSTQVAMATYLLPLLVLALLVLLPVAAIAGGGGDTTAVGMAAFGSLFFIWLAAMGTWLMYYRYFPAISGAVQAMEDPPLPIRGASAEGIWYLKRSFGLTQKYFWRCLGLTFLMSMALGFIQRGLSESVRLLVWLVWLPTHMPKGTGEEQIMAMIQTTSSSTVVAWSLGITSIFMLLTPGLILCYQNLLYFDLRFRKEGLDLELLLDRTGKRLPREPVATTPMGNVGI